MCLCKSEQKWSESNRSLLHSLQKKVHAALLFTAIELTSRARSVELWRAINYAISDIAWRTILQCICLSFSIVVCATHVAAAVTCAAVAFVVSLGFFGECNNLRDSGIERKMIDLRSTALISSSTLLQFIFSSLDSCEKRVRRYSLFSAVHFAIVDPRLAFFASFHFQCWALHFFLFVFIIATPTTSLREINFTLPAN